jgi:aspartate aminotransferase
MKISRRGQTIQASPIRKLKPFADKAVERGIRIYFLNIGDPDVPTPRPVIEAFHSFQDEVLSYGPAQGFLELRQAIADYFGHYQIRLTCDDIVVTTGGSEAILFAFCAVADPGREIIVPEPFYTNYNGFASLANIRLIPLTLRLEEGFHLPRAKDIEAKISPRTRAVLLCSPNNPTGTVYSQEELGRVARLVQKHDLFLIGDEVYKEFIYDGLVHKSVLEFEKIEDRTIVCDSISKRFSCCGARIGALITRNKDVSSAVLRFAQARLCPPSVEQKAALAAYRMGPGYFQPVREEYERRRNVLYEGLKSIPGIVLHRPEGAFYISLKIPVKDAEHFVRWMLTDFHCDGETVMVAPGQGFYCTPGKGLDEVRIAYVLNERDLRRAVEVLRTGLAKYRSLFS